MILFTNSKEKKIRFGVRPGHPQREQERKDQEVRMGQFDNLRKREAVPFKGNHIVLQITG